MIESLTRTSKKERRVLRGVGVQERLGIGNQKIIVDKEGLFFFFFIF